jgi:DNA polymerase-3 subunit epsilon
MKLEMDTVTWQLVNSLKIRVALKLLTLFMTNLLQELAKQFEIDQRFCKYGSVSDGETPLQTNNENLPDSDYHNDQIQAAIDFILNSRPSFAIIDKGRTNDERSYIWVENGRFYGGLH